MRPPTMNKINWGVLVVPGIALLVWILTSLFRRDDTPPPKQTRRPDRFEDAQGQRRSDPRLERRMQESRRRREEAARRAELSRPIMLEEVNEPPRRLKTPSTRAVLLEPDQPAPLTSLQETRAEYAPTQSPSKSAPVKQATVQASPTSPHAAQTSL